MAQFQVLADIGATEIQIAVLHADIITTIALLLNGEGRSSYCSWYYVAVNYDVYFLYICAYIFGAGCYRILQDVPRRRR